MDLFSGDNITQHSQLTQRVHDETATSTNMMSSGGLSGSEDTTYVSQQLDELKQANTELRQQIERGQRERLASNLVLHVLALAAIVVLLTVVVQY